MKQWIVIISLSIILVACQNGEETNNTTQVEQLKEQIESQNEEIEQLEQELEEKTIELQQARQNTTSEGNSNASNEEPNDSSSQIARTENFQLQTPKEGESINDTFSIQGMIRYEAIGSVSVELIDANGNVVNETQIKEEWFTQTTNEQDWTGIELNSSNTSSVASGEGKVVVHDELADEEAVVPVELE